MEPNSFLGNETLPIVAPSSDEKTISALAHVLTLIFPFFAPLIIFLIKKDDSAFIAAHAKESLNFQITIMIVCILLVISLVGILLLIFIGIPIFILVIVATIRASEGKLYRYPLTIRFIK